jgi:hypothetical protein
MSKFEIERDEEMFVWTTSEAAARRFFGCSDGTDVRIVTPSYDFEPGAKRALCKLYAVKLPASPAR